MQPSNGVEQRAYTPTEPIMKKSDSYETDYSPVPEGVMSSSCSPGSASDHMGSLPGPPNPLSVMGTSAGKPSWHAVTSGSPLHVPRVVSTLLPSSTEAMEETPSPVTSSNDLSKQRKQSDASGKPAAIRRRSPTKPEPTTQRRQKRLERNRESARLSRRRRKQYLEVLEDRVTEHSQTMDAGRRAHVQAAVPTILDKRQQLLESGLDNVLDKLQLLQTGLARTSQELMIVGTFQTQQLRSFCTPPSTKFILWLTLQTDTYFRGGRAASERLSAARIGERMLNSGNDRVPPSQSMWPLLCSEIGLSYEQEEKVRQFQKATIQAQDTWLDRHTTFASGKVMESAHDTTQALTLRLGQRERSALGILSPEQQFKFLAWAQSNKERVAQSTTHVPVQIGDDTYTTSETQHVAGNLYVLNHRLQSIFQKVPRAAPLVTGRALKKLSRRPSFESLGCVAEREKMALSRENSFASSGSLKRSASEMSMEGEERPHVPQLAPTDAQATAAPYVEQVLGHLKAIIPAPPTPTMVESMMHIPAPTPVSSMRSQSFAVAPAPAEAYPGEPAFNEAGQGHVRKSSFLPAHLNVVPEEFFAGDAAEDFLMNLVDEDWAIGEGIDMEMAYH